MKWLRKYPVLASVTVLAGATLSRLFGYDELGRVIEEVGPAVGVEGAGPLESPIAQLITAAAAVIAQAGVVYKLWSDRSKRKAVEG